MIIAGSKMIFKVCCPQCGHPVPTHLEPSEFFILCCQNEECLVAHSNVVIERRSEMILSVEAKAAFVDGEWRRITEAFYYMDRDEAKQVWPPKEKVR